MSQRIRIEVLVSDEQIEVMKCVAKKRAAKYGHKWTWRDLAKTWADIGIADRVREEAEKLSQEKI